MSAASTPAPLIPIADFFADASFSNASISPDGTRLAYIAPAYGRTNVWIRGIDQTHEQAVLITHEKSRGIKTYFWTDDPRYLLYRRDTDGNEDWHIYRVDLENPQEPAVDLTPLAPGMRAGGGMSSVDYPGHIIVSMNPRLMFFDVFRIELATGETTLIRENNDMFGNYFGPDTGAEFYANQGPDGSHDFYAVDDVETDSKRLIYSADGPTFPVGLFPLAVTPDAKGLLLGTYPEGSDELALVRIEHATGEQTVVAAEPGNSVCTNGMFEQDFGMPPTLFMNHAREVIAVRFAGDRPFVKAVHPGYTEIFETLASLSEGEIGWASSDLAEDQWVVSFLHDTRPGVTHLYDRRTGSSRLLYDPADELDPSLLAPMQAVSFSARDGLPLHAFLTTPVGVEPKNLPMVLMVHGGPWAHDVWGYNRDVQCLANRGYAVLQVNFRGSTGYGRRHITAAIRELAGKMHDDLIDACDWAVAEGIADQKRIGIYGGSYGGYSVLVGVTVTPDYFAAAVDYVGVSSLVDFQGNLPEFVKPALRNNWIAYAGDPSIPADREDMLKRSPATMTDRIVTPLLVVQGAKDARVAQSESDAIVESLRGRGVEVEYFVAEDEGHDFQNTENLVKMFTLIEQHFGEHLGGRTA